MTAFFLFLKSIGSLIAKLPWQVWAFFLSIVICYACILYGRHETQGKWDESVKAIALQNQTAVKFRLAENDQQRTKQAAISNTIQGIYDDEVKTFTASIASGKRLHIGTAICPSIARSADTNSAGGGDGTDPGGRLVREDVQRDIDALELKVEKALAAGRAAQEFIRQNGMAQTNKE